MQFHIEQCKYYSYGGGEVFVKQRNSVFISYSYYLYLTKEGIYGW